MAVIELQNRGNDGNKSAIGPIALEKVLILTSLAPSYDSQIMYWMTSHHMMPKSGLAVLRDSFNTS